MGSPSAAIPLSFADRVTQNLRQVEYRRAETDEDRDAIFRLRYEAYLKEGAIQPSFGRRLSDRYDDLDNGWLIGLHIGDRLVSSIRIHVAAPGYPTIVAADVFPEAVRPLLDAGCIIIDPTRFVVDPVAARIYPHLAYAAVRAGDMAAEHFAADYVLATVRPEHRAFYQRVFGHTEVAKPRPYPALTKELGLMMLNVDKARPGIRARYPFFESTVAERTAVFGPVPSAMRRPVIAANDAIALVS